MRLFHVAFWVKSVQKWIFHKLWFVRERAHADFGFFFLCILWIWMKWFVWRIIAESNYNSFSPTTTTWSVCFVCERRRLNMKTKGNHNVFLSLSRVWNLSIVIWSGLQRWRWQRPRQRQATRELVCRVCVYDVTVALCTMFSLSHIAFFSSLIFIFHLVPEFVARAHIRIVLCPCQTCH